MPLAKRQREIVAAARALLAAEGPEAVTVARIAAALGIKAPSLYKHFDGKRAIELALAEQGLTELAEAMEAAGEELAGLAAAYRAFARADPALYRLMTDVPPARELVALEGRVTAPLVRAVRDRDLARAVWGFLHGMAALELSGRFPPWADADAAWQKAVAAFTRGNCV